ncbi:UNVERIFIED_CONTAM: hypothetical protein FKN15_014666 [Acipenser sinensis]
MGDRSDNRGTGGCSSGQRSAAGARCSDVQSPRGSEVVTRGSSSDIWEQHSDVLVLGRSGAGNQVEICDRFCRLLGSRSSVGWSKQNGRVSRSEGRGTAHSSAGLEHRGGGRGCGGGGLFTSNSGHSSSTPSGSRDGSSRCRG